MSKKTDTLTAQQLANALGKNVDTVRKHAKAGKITGYQDKNGKWTFLVADFPDLFGNKNTTKVEPKLTDVIFVLDRSGSMGHLIGKARENLDSQLAELRKAADADNQYRVSVINFDDTISHTTTGTPIHMITSAAQLYLNPHGSTRLYDAVAEAISLSKTLDTKGKQHAFMISVLTDGWENASNQSLQHVRSLVQQATGTDRYTFAYAGPGGSKQKAADLGIPDGNVTEWDQTDYGISTLGATTRSSFQSYARSRSIGATKSTSFYAAPVTKDASKFAGQLDDKLDDVSTRVKVERVGTSDPAVIQKFCERKLGHFPKGQVYYQLTESEKVQDYKKLIVQDTTTGNFYAGNHAKKLLGVPNFTGTVKIKPGSLGEFKVFVQSTSYNRRLTPGTALVYLP